MKKTLFNRRIKALIIDISILLMVEILLVISFMLVVPEDFLFFYYMTGSIVYGMFFCKDIINGQSIGKKILKIQVVNNKGKVSSMQNLILRNVIALLQPIDAISIVTKGKRLGDVLCKTKVVSTLNCKIEYRYGLIQISICVIAVIVITVTFFYGLWIVLNWLVS